MKPSSQTTSHRKPVGGVRSVELFAANNVAVARFSADATQCNKLIFIDPSAVMSCSLLEDCSSFDEKFTFEEGVAAVQHTLRLAADRNLAGAWLEPEFQREAAQRGICALVMLNDGRQLLVGYSARFGAQQPLRVVQIEISSGCKLSDAPTIILQLEGFDTSAAAECIINQ